MRFVAVALVAAAVGLASCQRPSLDDGEQAAAPATEPSSAASATLLPPKPGFVLEDRQHYGYEAALTDKAKADGQMVSALRMFAYAGQREGEHQLLVFEEPKPGHVLRPTWIQSFECSANCEFVKATTYLRGKYQTTTHVRFEPRSILGAALQDAWRGFMKPYVYLHPETKERMQLWCNDKLDCKATAISKAS